MLLEDNADARSMLARTLELGGHEVRACADAVAALECAAARVPQIGVLDIGLPGMDGYELARELRERYGAGVALIALTGYGRENDRQRAQEAGFDLHLSKPVDAEQLLHEIAALGRRAPRARDAASAAS